VTERYTSMMETQHSVVNVCYRMMETCKRIHCWCICHWCYNVCVDL